MREKYELVLRLWGEIQDLREIQQLLEWDLQVTMPPAGAEQRSRHLEALAAVIHRKLTAPALGDLLAALEASPRLDEQERADVREAVREHRRAVRIPPELVAEHARAASLAQQVWQQAREENRFADFRPHLEHLLDLNRQIAATLGQANPYDALLEEYEPGETEASLRSLFQELRPRLVRLLDRLRGAATPPGAACLQRHFPAEAQEAFNRRLAADLGYDFSAGRLDRSAHPFTSGTLRDVRITTRYHERNLGTALFGTLHEAGHALYEQGLDPEAYRRPAGGACSMGIHESQSRLWENLIGRSGPFWRHYFPLLRQAFPGLLDDVTGEEFLRAINRSQPSLNRVEADEVTYNLHIILRFELESALVGNRLQVKDLPEAWNAGMTATLGLQSPTDREGVLQDIHWAAGLFGYFPTYTLGNLYAAQFVEALRRDLPDLDDRLARGELRPVREWLRERIHRHGRRWPAPELCRQVTGNPLSAEPAMNYLEEKYTRLYCC